LKLARTPKEFFANVDKVHVRHGQNLPLFDDLDAPISPLGGSAINDETL
jgi:hypothetical protein